MISGKGLFIWHAERVLARMGTDVDGVAGGGKKCRHSTYHH